MIIDTNFNIGDVVYLKTDNDQKKRLVTGFTIRKNTTLYILSCDVTESYHYDFEITCDVDVLITTTN